MNNYIKNKKKEKMLILFLQISILIITIILWQYLSDNNYINSFILSSPKRIIKTIINLHKQNNLLIHVFTTIYEVILSFIITSIFSLVISIILYYYKTLSKVLEPYLTILNSIPKVALGPLIIICFGNGYKSIIIMGILISIIVSIQNIYNAFKQTNEIKIKLLKTFNANKKDILLYLVIPSNKINILSTLKINISMCLIGVITGEFLASKQGIGYLILYGMQVFNLDLVMSGLFILIIISLLIYKIINTIIKE